MMDGNPAGRILAVTALVVCIGACSPSGEEGAHVVEMSPEDGATNVLTDVPIAIALDREVDELTVELSPDVALERGSETADAEPWRVVYEPTEGLAFDTTYTVSVSGPDVASTEWSFTTVPGELNDACKFADDGRCDEPARCDLGTDETDCHTACEAGENLAFIGAACAHRGLADDHELRVVDPSEGSGGGIGWFDRTTEVKSGTDPNVMVDRHYRVFVPSGYTGEAALPVVINMPGHRVGHEIMANHTQLPRSADLNDFIVVFAEQEFRDGRWAWWTDWDWGVQTVNNPDFEFLRDIVDEVGAEWNVDLSRVILSGHSRGAAMAFIGAMELPDLVAGAVVQSGFTEFGYLDTLSSAPDRKPALVFIHGTLDDDVCIDCAPGKSCGVNPSRACAPGMHASDAIVSKLRDLGWEDAEDLVYYRMDGVAHRWQSQLNQQWWDFLDQQPLKRGQ